MGSVMKYAKIEVFLNTHWSTLCHVLILIYDSQRNYAEIKLQLAFYVAVHQRAIVRVLK